MIDFWLYGGGKSAWDYPGNQVRDHLLSRAHEIPVQDLIGYLELGGPRLGGITPTAILEPLLRKSLRYLKEHFATVQDKLEAGKESPVHVRKAVVPVILTPAVRVAPSMMCADMSSMRDEIQRLESIGVDLLHWDIMDARFVPNMPCGLALLEQARKITTLPFDGTPGGGEQ